MVWPAPGQDQICIKGNLVINSEITFFSSSSTVGYNKQTLIIFNPDPLNIEFLQYSVL